MANVGDNVVLNEGYGGSVIATDEIAGVHHQKVKVEFGGDEAATQVTKETPLPVEIYGITDSGQVKAMPVTSEGHLEVAIHSPRLPFGSIHSESMTPIFQADGVYGVNSGQELAVSTGSGSATTEDSALVVSSGTTIFSQSVIQSRKRLRYRAGQGAILRFAGLFSDPVPLSYQVAGMGHSEDGYYFGYKDVLGNTPEFGILYVSRGVRAIYTLTVTTGATVAANCTITLNGVATNVALSAASNIQRTVFEIASANYTGWNAYPSGATVVFLAVDAGAKAGAFTFGAGTTNAAATFAQTKAGVAGNEIFIPQSQWNGDKLDGTGASGMMLDPQKGNVYQIGMQYLGFGVITFMVEAVPLDGNNPDFVVAHVIKNPNTRTTTHVGNPSFPFTMAVYSAGSTTDLKIEIGSFAGFIEGIKVLQGNRFSYFNVLTTVGSTNIQALFTVLNGRTYNGRANQSVVNLLSLAGAVKHTQPVVFFLIKNGALGGNPNFVPYSSISCTLEDRTATTVSYSTNDQIIWTGQLGETGNIVFDFSDDITLQPGEWVTLAQGL